MTTASGTRIRAGDRDREEVVDRVREAHVEGRLTLDELEQRVDAGYRATYLDELPALVADLPRAHVAAPATAGPGWDGPHQRLGPMPVLVLAAIVAGVVLVVTQHPPFPLLWLVVVWWFWRPSWFGVRRRHPPA